ncbi:NOL1/NOP2/sun family protein [Spirochaeta thermophila]|uniref:NOL1/NOP2/Sun domain family member 4 n=1 Tax=Winmispira thermophila (strain ATCC 49972 / DSM 6192 / RI 19.B1) TaxID=665571 RepID=E0RT00_WINT6|nr:NOL1/NOP2/sun family protein [Spirochaeta thermophila]ADN02137.1 NOL1/NOP2/sun family protein [Spirochaeta thermophila DSM 6192]
MKRIDKRPKGEEGFHEYYRSLFGERWDGLVASMRTESPYHTLSEGLLAPYHLDPASLYPPALLAPEPGHRVLDLCAAPGGKTLLLALALKGRGLLVANEYSSSRRARLKQVLTLHLPTHLLAPIRVAGRDGRTWGIHEPEAYDRILADVPCSSEAHLLSSPSHLSRWTPARIRNLTHTQFALLSSAFLALAPGGLLVYATCALTPQENDGVVEKLVTRRGNALEIVQDPPPLPASLPPLTLEPTRYGFHILPDTSRGAGPLYMALIRKTRSIPLTRP